MPKPPTPALTKRESQIMEILHRRGKATVEEVRAELPDAPGRSSVRKLMEIMLERGHLTRAYDGPRYVYSPATRPEEARRSALRSLLHTFFDDSPGSLIATLVDVAGDRLDPAEYDRLSRELDRARDREQTPEATEAE
jgi:predicted transcriptional regulator